MKRIYESPVMFAEIFVANQYVAACSEPIYNVKPMMVRCTSADHNNTQEIKMFLDSQIDCIVKFNPGVGTASGDKFKTQFEACAYVVGCNRQKWLKDYPNDTSFEFHVKLHHTPDFSNDGFVMHDTEIYLSTAEKYQLS